MSLRDAINKKPGISVAVLGGIVVLLLAWIVSTLISGGPAVQAASSKQSFYSNDDGKTYYPDAPNLLPAEKDGKPIAQAMVFEAGEGPKVLYLLRLSPAAENHIRAKRSSLTPEDFDKLMALPANVQVKRPGEPKWHDMGSSDALTILAGIRDSEGLKPVFP